MNKSKNKVNQPPTGSGKKESTQLGEDVKLGKRSEGVQAQHGRWEENIDTQDNFDVNSPNPRRDKAGH